MQTTPKSLRLQIAIFGQTNVGKSTLLNLIANQDVSIVSEIAGTTTDIVEKTMELFPIGPVVLLDSAGFADESLLGEKRMEKTKKLFDRADIVLLVVKPNVWGDAENMIIKEAKKRDLNTVVVINQFGNETIDDNFVNQILDITTINPIITRANNRNNRDQFLHEFKERLLKSLPEEFIKMPSLLADLIHAKDTVVLLIPIDIQAPKGRIILPQVQVLRECLDLRAIPVMCKESEYVETLKNLNTPPALVICDSQVVHFMISNTPNDIPCTTFSILFSRLKADMDIMAQGALSIDKLQDGDKVLLAESCTHHPTADDIGRVKIPRWLKAKTQKNLIFEFHAGHDFPDNLSEYKLIIQCGSCMLNRRETLSRVNKAVENNIPISNYGMVISFCQGVFSQVMKPFKI